MVTTLAANINITTILFYKDTNFCFFYIISDIQWKIKLSVLSKPWSVFRFFNVSYNAILFVFSWSCFTHNIVFAFVLHLRFDNILIHWILFYIFTHYDTKNCTIFHTFEFGTLDSDSTFKNIYITINFLFRISLL